MMTFKTVLTERGYEVGEYDAKTGVIELEPTAPAFPTLAEARAHQLAMEQHLLGIDNSYTLGYAHACGYHD